MNAEICKETMLKEDLKCVAADEEKIVFRSDKKGIVPMLELLELYDEKKIRPVYQSDRILGKAAAIIAVYCGIRSIYSVVVSQTAKGICERHGIELTYDTLVEQILDHSRSKMGPFEMALHHVDENDFEQSIKVIRETLAKMKSGK